MKDETYVWECVECRAKANDLERQRKGWEKWVKGGRGQPQRVIKPDPDPEDNQD